MFTALDETRHCRPVGNSLAELSQYGYWFYYAFPPLLL
jgi:hypothetical protein